MCDECEQAEPLTAVYLRKANRHGWRPPAKAATSPRYRDDDARLPASAPAPLACTAASATAGSR
jgi:hypothetical protein